MRAVATTLLLVLAALARAAAGEPCAPPNECVPVTLGEPVRFGLAGQELAFKVAWKCNDTDEEPSPQRPVLEAIELQSPYARLVSNRSHVSGGGFFSECTTLHYEAVATFEVSSDVAFAFRSGGASRDIVFTAEACLGSALGCETSPTHGCCTGAEKWDLAASFDAPACDPSVCCCLSLAAASAGPNAATLRLSGLFSGHSCGFHTFTGTKAFDVELPMPAGDTAAFEWENRTVEFEVGALNGRVSGAVFFEDLRPGGACALPPCHHEVGGAVLNFTALKGASLPLEGANESYALSVCGAAAACGGDAYLCQFPGGGPPGGGRDSVSLARWAADGLGTPGWETLSNGTLAALAAENGAPACGGAPCATTVEFVCDESVEGGSGTLAGVALEGGTYVATVRTGLACAEPVPHCGVGAGQCVLSTPGGNMAKFTASGQPTKFEARWTCNNPAQAPRLVNLTLDSPWARLVGGPESSESTLDGCRVFLFAATVAPAVSTAVTFNMAGPDGAPRQARDTAEACFPSAPACTSGCCNGAEKWAEASFTAPACNSSACCCLTEPSVSPNSLGTELRVSAVFSGASCGLGANRTKLDANVPMPAGNATTFEWRGRNVTFEVVLPDTGGVEGRASWSNGSAGGESCAPRPPPPSPPMVCAPAGRCQVTPSSQVLLFTRPGAEVSFNLSWLCNSTAAHPITRWPALRNVTLDSPFSAVVNTTSRAPSSSHGCTVYGFSTTIRAADATTATLHFTVPHGEAAPTVVAEPCFHKTLGCTSKCCSGLEKWSAASFEAPACDSSKCCCLSQPSVTVEGGRSLQLEGLFSGHGCGSPGAPFVVSAPVAPGNDTVTLEWQGRTFTLSVAAAGGDGGAARGTLEWKDARSGVAPACATGHGRGGGGGGGGGGGLSNAEVFGIVFGGLAVAVLLLVAVNRLCCRKRGLASSSSSGAPPLLDEVY